MKLSQLSISVLLLVCIVVSSCTQRRYGHLTIRVGSKKHQNVKVNSIRPFHGRLPNNIVSTWKGKDSAYGLSELTSIQQSLKNTYQPVLQVNKHLEPISAEHPIKRIRTSDTKAKFDEIDVLHPPRAKTKETTVTNYGSKNKNSLILAGTAAITSYISLFMLLGRGKLRKHVEWAKKNKKLARGMLIASRVFLGLIGLQLGALAADVGYVISAKTTAILSVVLALNILAYPSKKSKLKLFRSSLLRRKIQDLVFGTITLALLTSFGNISSQESNSDSVGASITNVLTVNTNVPQNSNIVEFEKPKTEEVLLNILLTILALALLAIILYLTAILACELSCSGQETLAVVVLIFGIVGGLALFLTLMTKIWAKRG